MSRLTDLIARAKAKDPQLGADLAREFKALSGRRAFGLNFERHQPEAVELPNRPVRKGDKVRVLPKRGSEAKGDQRLWIVKSVVRGMARIELASDEPQTCDVSTGDLAVVAEFRDFIYPGLVSTGKVERGGDMPYHTVITAENFHALQMLTYTHRGRIDAIYIDPPYNTGARDWKYNNDFVEADDQYRHSKWLAMMERRLLLARELLNPRNSVMIVTIDEKEYLRLGLLLEQTFPEASIQMVSVQINPANVSRRGAFGRNDEYVFFVMFGEAGPAKIVLNAEWFSARGRTYTGSVRWDLLRRSGSNARRSDRPNQFYPVYVDPTTGHAVDAGEPIALHDDHSNYSPPDGLDAVWPIRKDGSHGNWQLGPAGLKAHIEQGRVRVSKKGKSYVIYYIQQAEWERVKSSFDAQEKRSKKTDLEEAEPVEKVRVGVPGSQWRIAAHDATQYGSRLLSKFVPGRPFPFPKSLYAVQDCLRFFVTDKPDAIVLDFFSGSGTTAHAIMRLNREDNGRRQCISVTNNEVAPGEQTALREKGLRAGDPEWEQWGICDHITKPRIAAAITGRTPDGQSIKGDYKFTDEFPMADGFAQNAEFFTLTYESPVAVDHGKSFERIAPLLWMRAGSRGERIETLPAKGWAVTETYGLLSDLDQADSFLKDLANFSALRIAYVVTNDNKRFEAVARQLPEGVEAVRLYESYLTNFRFASGGEA